MPRLSAMMALVLMATFSLLVAAAPARPQNRTPPLGLMDEWGRRLSAAEGRALRAEVRRLSAQLKVRENTLAAIARILGSSFQAMAFPELVQRVQEQAKRAAELQAQIRDLAKQIRRVPEVAVRMAAEQALARATAAFDAGRFDEADREFASLQTLRETDAESARQAAADAVSARARIAMLRLDYDLADHLLETAAADDLRLSKARRWRFHMDRADARYQQGDLQGSAAALERALAIYDGEALPLAPRTERPLDWAATQAGLGDAYTLLGEWEDSRSRQEMAVAAYERALEEYSPTRMPVEWAMAKYNLASALARIGEHESGTEHLELALAAVHDAIDAFAGRANHKLEWSFAHNNLGNILYLLGLRESGTARLTDSISAFRTVLKERTLAAPSHEWAIAQNNLGSALFALGERKSGLDELNESRAAFASALTVWKRDRMPVYWALATLNDKFTVALLAERTRSGSGVDEAIAAAADARAAAARAGHQPVVAQADDVLRELQRIKRLLSQTP
jgi:tetratricopeptide (TPR) repeat protein